jgi:HPt (histidine-containing phosphotransfer) domain-containing protein
MGQNMKIEDVINRKELSERLDRDLALFNELADIFISDSVNLISKIEDTIKAGDSQALGKAAHTLKGAVSNFSAKKAYESALALEKIGKNSEMNLVPAAFEELKNEINIVKEALKLLKKESTIE